MRRLELGWAVAIGRAMDAAYDHVIAGADTAGCLLAGAGGSHGLRVVDPGAMPTIVSGNTGAPMPMMAEKAARRIMAEG